MAKRLTILFLALGVGCGVALIVILLLVKTDLGVSKTFFEKELSNRLGVPVEIERLERSRFYPLKFKVFNIKIGNPQGYRGSIAGTIERADILFSISTKNFPHLKGVLSEIKIDQWQLFGDRFTGVLTFLNKEDIFPLHFKIYNSFTSLSGELNYVREKLQFYNLNCTMGITNIRGQGYYFPKTSEVYATVVGQDMFFDDFIKSSFGKGKMLQGLLKGLPKTLHAIQGKMHVRFDHVYFNGATLSNFNAFLKLKDGGINLDPLSWEMAGGRIFLVQSLRFESGIPIFTSHVAIKDVDSNELLLAFHAQNYNRVSGTLYTKASFVMRGRNEKELRQNLTGNGFIQIREGRFNTPLFSQSAWKAIPVREVASLFLSERRVSDDFTLLQTPFSIEKEKFYTNDIMVFNPDGEIGMEGRGYVQFDSSLKYDGRYYCLLNKYEQYVIPFEVQGTIDRPETSLDVAAASQESITRAGAKFFIQDDRTRVFNMGVSILDQLLPLLP